MPGSTLRSLWSRLFPPGIGRGHTALRVLGLVVFVVLAVRSWRSAVRGSYDFDGFWYAGQFVLDHGLLSDEKNVARYLPHFQVLHVPFALLPIGLAGLVWYLVSVAALLATPREIERLTGVPLRAQWPAWFVAAPFVIDNLHLGQSGTVLLWGLLYATNRARCGAPVAAGALLGLLATFKVPAIALAVPAVLLGRPLRVLAGWLAAAAVVSGLLVAAVGSDQLVEGTADWYEFVRTEQTAAGMVEHDHALRHNNQSISIVLARTFGKMSKRKRRGAPVLARLPQTTIWRIAYAITGLLLLIGAACAIRARMRWEARESWLAITALGALGLLFTSPLVWTHYFLLALPAVVALRARPATLYWIGAASMAGLAIEPARDLGFHMWGCVAIYLVLAFRFLRGELFAQAVVEQAQSLHMTRLRSRLSRRLR